jgi:HD superfamily phosphohydrolase
VQGGADRGLAIADPLYQYVEVPAALIPIVDHPAVQRLRRISQTSLASWVYPSLTGTRFAHSLGVMHLARRAFFSMWAHAEESVVTDLLSAARLNTQSTFRELQKELLANAVGGMALLHDVGHPPFSHVLEHDYRLLFDRYQPDCFGDLPHSAFHEQAGRLIAIDVLDEITTRSAEGSPPLGELIKQLITADKRGTWNYALRSLVDGIIDADRIDYVQRDAYLAGTEYGKVNHQKITSSLELGCVEGEFSVSIGIRARAAVETLLYNRLQSHANVYSHSRVGAFENALRQLFRSSFSAESDFEEINYVRRRIPEPQEQDAPKKETFKRYEIWRHSLVDDGAVLTGVSNRMIGGKLDEQMDNADLVFFRDKHNQLSVWKRVDEYESFAEPVVISLRSSLARLDRSEFVLRVLSTMQTTSWAIGLNKVLDVLTTMSKQLDVELVTHLNSTKPRMNADVAVTWECFIRRPKLSGVGELQLQSHTGPLAITRVSQIARSIPEIEASLPALQVHFRCNQRTTETKDALRQWASSSLKESLPSFLFEKTRMLSLNGFATSMDGNR